jgi:carboxypeptidase T
MPPRGYLTAAGVESALEYLANTYPPICQLIVLPEQSYEGRTIRAVKIASRADGDRPGVLFIGGVHAREIVNPDLLVSFALNLCQAYTSGTGLTFGGRSYDSSTVRMLVDTLDIFILPLVNPDGRVYVQSPTGDAFWRKNRNPNPGLPCQGIDLNRNYDCLWSSGIGTSANSCSDVFRGSNAFSEPETRNVRHLLDDYPNIMGMIDVHSFLELVLYPWGDDDNQSTDPSMNFTNPAYDGMRGTAGDSIYREYMPQTDEDWFATTGERIKDAIAAVRGRVYRVEPSINLYPTSGTSKDYAYSRHFVDATKRKVFAYTVETGTEFQPPYSEALNIISEVSSGLVEFSVVVTREQVQVADAPG